MKIALNIKVKNGILQKYIDDRGINQSEFAREMGVNPSTMGDWFNLKDYPRSIKRVKKLEELTGHLIEDIFPDVMRTEEWKKIPKKMTVYKEIENEALPWHQQKALVADFDMDRNIEGNTLEEAVDKVLSGLTSREEKIIKMRLGIGEFTEEHTLEQVSEIFGLSRNRIRQIEVKALRKLRHPSRRKKLEEYL